MSQHLPSVPLSVSFEFFPPADAVMEATLWNSVERLAPLAPRFVSVTYGADGSTRERTHNVVSRIQQRTALTGAPHLTCVGASRAEILDIARGYWSQGIRHLVALRGDPARGQPGYTPRPDGFAYASDLVAGLAALSPIRHFRGGLSGGASRSALGGGRSRQPAPQDRRRRDPARSRSSSTTATRSCVSATAAPRPASARRSCPASCRSRAFRRCCASPRGCGASIPSWLHERFAGLDDDDDTRRMIAASVAIEQVQELTRHGVREFHFYTLNRAELTYAICHALGVRPASAACRTQAGVPA